MQEQKLRTIRLRPTPDDGSPVVAEREDVLLAAVGMLRSASAGRSVLETLATAGVAPPAAHQTLRINSEVVHDLGRTLKPGDKLTIVNKVVGG
jgi:hypothetical protein